MAQNSSPLDVRKIKDIVQRESAKLSLRSFSHRDEVLFTLALALIVAVKKVFYEKSEMTFSREPRLEKKPITQFLQKMRVDGMGKFNAPAVFSVIQFAADEAGLERQDYLMTLVIYLEQRFLPEFLRLLQYPYVDSEDEAELRDGCGSVVNLIAGQYKREIGAMGYKDLMMSHFSSYINTAADGVEIPKGSTERFELSFEIEDTKRLVAELIVPAVIPKWQPLDNSANKKILVIDDDMTFIKIIEPFLKSHRFEVMVAHDGEEGIKKLSWCPDLIILDIRMPHMDGYEFVLTKKKVEGAKQIPVIVLTALEGMSEMFKVEGAREYLLKPLQPENLLKSIQRYI